MALIKITFTQWAKWNPRKDIKTPTWFAMSNRITEDDDIQTLSDAEFRAFIHLACLASQKASASVIVNFEKAFRVTGKKADVFRETVSKLESLGIISTEPVRDTYASRTDGVRDPNATLQDTTLQDMTGHDTQPGSLAVAPPSVFRPSDLIEVWNEHSGSLPKIKALGKGQRAEMARLRCLEHPDRNYWVEVVKRIARSRFCNGQAKGSEWRASFEFLVRPDTHLKVLEGKYDNRDGTYDDTNWDRVFTKAMA